MATDQQFCLRWNNHQSTLISVFDSLLENGTLVDCTLAAEGQYLKAHKVVLSACSPYLETLLSQHYEKHPIVILKDVKFSELKSMMDYMYRGEVNISQDQLGTFLKAAESLQIKGLSDNGDDARDVGSTAKKPDAPRPSVTQTRAPVESKRPAPVGDLSDTSRDGSISPSSLRKRRRTRRPSQGDDPDSNLDNNICDLPAAQSTPMPVPSAAPVQSLPKQIVKTEPPPPMPEPVKKEILDPPAEPLLEPKTEYLDYMNNENSIEVEDLTLDDDDEEGLDSSMDASRPGPSHGDLSQQGGYPPWTMTGDQSGTDEIFMAAQEAVGAATGQQQRDSQDPVMIAEAEQIGIESLQHDSYVVYYQCSDCTVVFADEVSHENHICPVKCPVTISVVGEAMSLTEKYFDSIKSGSFIKLVEKKGHLAHMEEAVLKIDTGENLAIPVSEKKKQGNSISKKKEEKKNARIEKERLEKENKKVWKVKALLMYVCSKCKVVFKEPILYEKHSCTKQNLEKKGEENSTSSSEERNQADDRELMYQCTRCQVTFENMSEFKGHPCFWEKGDPLINAVKFEHLKQDSVESTDSIKVGPDSNNKLEEIPNSTIVPLIKQSEDSGSSLTNKNLFKMLKQEKNQTGPPYLCSGCNKYFKKRYNLGHHSCIHPSKNPLPHGALGKPPYICSKCGISFKHKPSFCRHIHHVCNTIEKPTKITPPISPENLVNNATNQNSANPGSSKEKPFQCPNCKKNFARKYYMIHHACDPPSNNPLPRGSLGKPPFLCSGCGVIYKHKQSYCRHIHHECGKGRKFFKTYTGKYAGRSNNKKVAIETQVCILCNSKFQDQDALEAHVQADHFIP